MVGLISILVALWLACDFNLFASLAFLGVCREKRNITLAEIIN